MPADDGFPLADPAFVRVTLPRLALEADVIDAYTHAKPVHDRLDAVRDRGRELDPAAFDRDTATALDLVTRELDDHTAAVESLVDEQLWANTEQQLDEITGMSDSLPDKNRNSATGNVPPGPDVPPDPDPFPPAPPPV